MCISSHGDVAYYSYSSYKMSSEVTEAGENQRLSSHGGGVHQKPRKTQTTGGET